MLLFQSSLPCSENFYRYKKNYEKFLDGGPKSSGTSPKASMDGSKSDEDK